MSESLDVWTPDALSSSLLESLDLGVIGLDNQYRIMVWNPWMTARTGLGEKTLRTRRLQEIFPDLPPKTLETIKHAMNTGQPRVLSPVLHPDWFPPIKARHQFVRLLPLLTEDKVIPGVLIMIRDVSGAMEDEKRLAERYRSLVESFSDHIFMLGRDGIFLVSNNPVTKFPLQNGEELSGRHYSDVLPDDVAEQYRKQIEKLLATGRQVQFEHEIPGPDGPRYHMDTLYSVFRDNALLAIGGACRDITERKSSEKEKKRIEDQLRQSQKMEAVGLLASGVAHDFNNHLSVIMGNADLISMDMDERSLYKENLAGITHAAESAASLTRQLLIFGRKEIALPEIISLNDVLTGLEKMLQRLIGENIRFVTVKPPDLEPVMMDPGQLEQVIMNLVVNARDAMPKGGPLTIETSNVDLDEAFFRAHGPKPAAGPYVMLSVVDSGVGMDGETRSRIFEPFFTTKEKGKGTGLGLATAYGIVKQAKGYVWAYSEPGKGTTFKIYFPVAERGEETGIRKETKSPAEIKGTETILLVEDDVSVRNLMEAILKRDGYEVIPAEDGNSAIAVSEEHAGEIELLLADVVLPGIGGREMSDKMRVKRPEMKILFVSGYTEEIVSRFGVVPSDMNFLAKPVTPKSLSLKVREMLDQD